MHPPFPKHLPLQFQLVLDTRGEAQNFSDSLQEQHPILREQESRELLPFSLTRRASAAPCHILTHLSRDPSSSEDLLPHPAHQRKPSGTWEEKDTT